MGKPSRREPASWVRQATASGVHLEDFVTFGRQIPSAVIGDNSLGPDRPDVSSAQAGTARAQWCRPNEPFVVLEGNEGAVDTEVGVTQLLQRGSPGRARDSSHRRSMMLATWSRRSVASSASATSLAAHQAGSSTRWGFGQKPPASDASSPLAPSSDPGPPRPTDSPKNFLTSTYRDRMTASSAGTAVDLRDARSHARRWTPTHHLMRGPRTCLAFRRRDNRSSFEPFHPSSHDLKPIPS